MAFLKDSGQLEAWVQSGDMEGGSVSGQVSGPHQKSQSLATVLLQGMLTPPQQRGWLTHHYVPLKATVAHGLSPFQPSLSWIKNHCKIKQAIKSKKWLANLGEPRGSNVSRKIKGPHFPRNRCKKDKTGVQNRHPKGGGHNKNKQGNGFNRTQSESRMPFLQYTI